MTHRGETIGATKQMTVPKRELPSQLRTLHWFLRTCYGPSNTGDLQDFIAKLKIGVEQPELLLALKLAHILAHTPMETSGSVAVTGLLLLQRNIRIVMSSKTLCLWSCFFCWHPERWSCHRQVGKRTLQLWHWNEFIVPARAQLLLLWKTNIMSILASQGATTDLMYLWPFCGDWQRLSQD